MWGLIAVGVFDNTKGIIYQREGRGYFLGMQVAGMAAIIGWVATLTFFYFVIMKLLKIDRISIAQELMGFDISEMGVISKHRLMKMK